MSWPTTRKHPRSLAEAFPRDHASAIEHYSAKGADALRIVVFLVSIAVIGVGFGMWAAP